MGVDLVHIVRNNFNDMSDKTKAISYQEATAEKLRKFLCCNGDVTTFVSEFEDSYEYYINIKCLDASLQLFNGFWINTQGYRYHQLFFGPDDNFFWLRSLLFDITRALGEVEAWLCSEYEILDYDFDIYNYNNSFTDWLAQCEEPEEFNPEDILKQTKVLGRDFEYKPIYHDTFNDKVSVLQNLQRKFPQYRIISVSLFGDHIMVEDKGELKLLNIKAQTFLDVPRIDCIDSTTAYNAIILHNGEKSALFDQRLNQLTPYRIGDFETRFDNTDFSTSIITDLVTHEEYIIK